MTKEEATRNIQQIKQYLCSGNPIWNVDTVAETLDIALKALKQSGQQWIPCSERLPEYDAELYIVTDYCEQINRKRMHLSYCYMNTSGFWSDVPLGYKVLAWMPLPKPYEEGKK